MLLYLILQNYPHKYHQSDNFNELTTNDKDMQSPSLMWPIFKDIILIKKIVIRIIIFIW